MCSLYFPSAVTQNGDRYAGMMGCHLSGEKGFTKAFQLNLEGCPRFFTCQGELDGFRV